MSKPQNGVGMSSYDVAVATAAAPGRGLGARVAAERARGDTSEAFHRLLLAMIPPNAHCGGVRRFHAGYHRMCALTWRVGPDQFWPGMTAEAVAQALGISYRAFKKHLEVVDAYLGRTGV